MSKERYLYIHCGTYAEFTRLRKQQIDYHCVMIVDGETLRGRTPGEFLVTESAATTWNHQEIAESIAIHEELWANDIEKQKIQSNDENILDYGIE